MMDQLSQDRLNMLVQQEVKTLTADDCSFLRARRSYLNSDEKKKLEKVLKVEAPVVDDSSDEGGEEKGKSRAELMKEAKKMGIKTGRSMKVPQIQALIDNAKFEAEAEEEMKQAEAEALKAKEEADKKANELEKEANKVGHKGNFAEDAQEAATK